MDKEKLKEVFDGIMKAIEGKIPLTVAYRKFGGQASDGSQIEEIFVEYGIISLVDDCKFVLSGKHIPYENVEKMKYIAQNKVFPSLEEELSDELEQVRKQFAFESMGKFQTGKQIASFKDWISSEIGKADYDDWTVEDYLKGIEYFATEFNTEEETKEETQEAGEADKEQVEAWWIATHIASVQNRELEVTYRKPVDTYHGLMETTVTKTGLVNPVDKNEFELLNAASDGSDISIAYSDVVELKYVPKCGTSDNVNHPDHYNRGGYECQDVMDALDLSSSKGAAFKYIWRAGHKIDYPDEPNRDEIEDLRKAAWYCNREANRLEGKSDIPEMEEQILNEDIPNPASGKIVETPDGKWAMKPNCDSEGSQSKKMATLQVSPDQSFILLRTFDPKTLSADLLGRTVEVVDVGFCTIEAIKGADGRTENTWSIAGGALVSERGE